MAGNERTLNNAKKYAKLRGMSLREVSDRAGLSSTSVYGWSHYTPKLGVLTAVADVLGVTPGDLDPAYKRRADKPSTHSIDLATALDDGTPLTYAGRTLDDVDRTILRRVLSDH